MATQKKKKKTRQNIMDYLHLILRELPNSGADKRTGLIIRADLENLLDKVGV